MISSLNTVFDNKRKSFVDDNIKVKPFPAKYVLYTYLSLINLCRYPNIQSAYDRDLTPFQVALLLYNSMGRFADGKKVAFHRWYYEESVAKHKHEQGTLNSFELYNVE